ncbi:bifunctional Ribosomal protein L7-L12 [Babesia duncani]|uniref:Bifunctional Ribosomal protein L7-L12 n=1 Tax=Babesia duncani TaxID=323732 RepID=A0AAD9UQH7_9APIC|nr:bifunctional Ribosomal protein L7-L12 [Babesia duncani]
MIRLLFALSLPIKAQDLGEMNNEDLFKCLISHSKVSRWKRTLLAFILWNIAPADAVRFSFVGDLSNTGGQLGTMMPLWSVNSYANRAAFIRPRQCVAGPGTRKLHARVDNVLEEIKQLTLLETAELVKKIQDAFGVSANVTIAAPIAAAPAQEPDDQDDDDEDDVKRVVKDSWEVVMTAVEAGRRMDMFRALKAMFPEKDLTTIKSHVDNLPYTIGVFSTQKEADEAYQKIKDAGGVVEIS